MAKGAKGVLNMRGTEGGYIVGSESDRFYWGVVRYCLTKFHKLPAEQADQKIADLRARLEGNTMIYHEEPFVLANRMCKKDASWRKHRTEYLNILFSSQE